MFGPSLEQVSPRFILQKYVLEVSHSGSIALLYLSIIYAPTDDDFPVNRNLTPLRIPHLSKQALRFEIDRILTAIFALPGFSAYSV